MEEPKIFARKIGSSDVSEMRDCIVFHPDRIDFCFGNICSESRTVTEKVEDLV